jgi:hypothetical protein
MSAKAFPQIQQSPSGYALPGAKRFLSESLGFQFYEHSVKLPKLQETRGAKSRYGSLESAATTLKRNLAVRRDVNLV